MKLFHFARQLPTSLPTSRLCLAHALLRETQPTTWRNAEDNFLSFSYLQGATSVSQRMCAPSQDGVFTPRSIKMVSKFSVKQERRYREILQPIQVKKGVACHAHTDYRIDPKISKSLSLGIISVPMKFGSISLKNGDVIQVSCVYTLLFGPTCT